MIWLLLFLAVLITSFLLALRSMRHYREKPSNLKGTFSLYLIQNMEGLTDQLLEELAGKIKEGRLLLSFERLYKGDKKALVVFGPTEVLTSVSSELGLLELEDYTQKSYPHSLAFEVGERASGSVQIENFQLPVEEIGLAEGEQIWWQVIAQPNSKNNQELIFNSLIRVCIHATESQRVEHLKNRLLFYLQDANLTRLPQTHTSQQILKFYRERAIFNLFASKKEHLELSLNQLRKLLK